MAKSMSAETQQQVKSRRPTFKLSGVGDSWQQLPQHPSVWYSFRSWVMPDSSGQRWRSANYVGDEADVANAGIMIDEPSLSAVRIIARCPTKAQPSRISVWYHLREWAGHDVDIIDRLPGAASTSTGTDQHPARTRTKSLAVVLTHPRFDRPAVHQTHPNKRKGTINFRRLRARRQLSGEKKREVAQTVPPDPRLWYLVEAWRSLDSEGKDRVLTLALQVEQGTRPEGA